MKLFVNDLIKFVTKIRAGINKIVLAADINEHVVEGNFSRALIQISLTESFYKMIKKAGTYSYDREGIQKDGL